MVTPDTQSAEAAPAGVGQNAKWVSSANTKSVDEQVAGLNRIGIVFVLVAVFGLFVSLAGLFTNQFYVVLAGVGFVALGALAWVGAVLAATWKMGRELLLARRAHVSESSFGQSEQAPEIRAYPNNPAALKAMRAQAKCRKAM